MTGETGYFGFFKNILLNYKKRTVNLFLITNLVIIMAAATRHGEQHWCCPTLNLILWYLHLALTLTWTHSASLNIGPSTRAPKPSTLTNAQAHRGGAALILPIPSYYVMINTSSPNSNLTSSRTPEPRTLTPTPKVRTLTPTPKPRTLFRLAWWDGQHQCLTQHNIKKLSITLNPYHIPKHQILTTRLTLGPYHTPHITLSWF